MESFEGYLEEIKKLEDTISEDKTLGIEELVLLAYNLGSLHTEILERIDPELGKRRRLSYSKSESEKQTKCQCGGKQLPKYVLENPKRYVCQQCYKKKRKK